MSLEKPVWGPYPIRLRPCPGPDALTVEEVVLDELVERVEAQGLVVDEAGPGVRADHQRGNAEAVSVAVDVRRANVVVASAPVVPGQEDRRARPVGAGHDRVD